MKKVTTAVLAGMFFVNFSASANEIQKPDFLAHTTDAVFVGESEMSEVRGEGVFFWPLMATAGGILWDVYFNDARGAIYATARTLEKLGYPDMVNRLRDAGLDF